MKYLIGNQTKIETMEAKQYTKEDMKSFAEFCRNGLLNSEYSVRRLDAHLESWHIIINPSNV